MSWISSTGGRLGVRQRVMPENKSVAEQAAENRRYPNNLSALNVAWVIEIAFCYIERFLNQKLCWNDSTLRSTFLVQGLLYL